MKDHFSTESGNYARYRPTYPPELFEWLIRLVKDRKSCWDCGTGTGQVAASLSGYFKKVHATDISRSQIDHAVKRENITYSIAKAEHTSFPDNYFDLIVVAQAIHWFDFDKFFLEAKRTIKPGGVLTIIGYSVIKINDELDKVILDFYKNIIGPYWDEERKYIDEEYKTIPFPFNEVKTPPFEMRTRWSLDELTGYLRTWSAVKHYIKANGIDPVEDLKGRLSQYWHEPIQDVKFPLLMRVGKI
ncbi:MAG: class I SAM-dependent methyltransferase [Balneolales bacterium]